MNIAPNSYSSTRRRLTAAVASLATIGAVGTTAVFSGTMPVLADAVHVEAPQSTGFANIVERVSPAVVSVKVKSTVQPTADDGSDDQGGFDNLPDNPRQPSLKQGGKPRPVAQGSGFFISEDGYLTSSRKARPSRL